MLSVADGCIVAIILAISRQLLGFVPQPRLTALLTIAIHVTGEIR